MMKTKNILFLVAIFFALSNSVYAQEKLDKLFSETTAEERATHQTDRMKEKLALSEEQKPKVYEINLKYAKLMEQAYRQGGGKVQRLRRMKSVSEQKDGELKKTLDAGQYAQYEKIKEELRDAMKERRSENKNR